MVFAWVISRTKRNHMPKEGIMGKKEAYQEKVTAQLRELEANIARLQAKADQAHAEAKIESYEKIEELRAKRDLAQQKLEELREAGDEAWEELKAGIENAWDDLRTAMQNALARIK
jgi:uncharacterized coiled-coil DUF342 family protein